MSSAENSTQSAMRYYPNNSSFPILYDEHTMVYIDLSKRDNKIIFFHINSTKKKKKKKNKKKNK